MKLMLSSRAFLRCSLAYLAIFAVVTLVIGCDILRQDPQLERLFPLFVELSDLPSGWKRGEATIEKVEGAISRTYGFRGSDDPDKLYVNVSQQLTIYPDVTAAVAAYPGWVHREFPASDWKPPLRLAFRSRADQFDLRCISFSPSGGMVSCRALGRYGDVIALIYANVFDDKWLTFADFERLLDRADERLYEGTKLKPTP